jgi:hypothetical protein
MLQDRGEPPAVRRIRQSAELGEVPSLRLRLCAVGEGPEPRSQVVGAALVTARPEIDPRQQFVRFSPLRRSRPRRRISRSSFSATSFWFSALAREAAARGDEEGLRVSSHGLPSLLSEGEADWDIAITSRHLADVAGGLLPQVGLCPPINCRSHLDVTRPPSPLSYVRPGRQPDGPPPTIRPRDRSVRRPSALVYGRRYS